MKIEISVFYKASRKNLNTISSLGAIDHSNGFNKHTNKNIFEIFLKVTNIYNDDDKLIYIYIMFRASQKHWLDYKNIRRCRTFRGLKAFQTPQI